MSINVEKTNIMVIAREGVTTEITLDGRHIEQVGYFKYLGTFIDSKGRLAQEINGSIQAANKTYASMKEAILNNRQIPK